ncbi:MAG: glycoside hydrolase family 3 C-terminal domain-containing protein [Eubacteriales bacterium]|nr:glycoside hydrolase family 3 C-terminal domain-containing protein [Eubacteriales bacterium]
MKYTLDYQRYAELAERTAAEGCVLLRNEDRALPIRRGERVSVFGRIQFTYYKSGTGSGGMVNAPYVTNILDCLKECPDIEVNGELEQVYRDWIAKNPFDMGAGWAQEPWSQKEMPVDAGLVKKAAAVSDLAVVVLGRTAGEDNDNSAAPGSYLLTAEEEALLKEVCSAFSRTAVVLNVGNIIDMSWVERYQPRAVLYVWQGGQEGGRAAARVLCGAENPSGRLADTIAANIADYPSTAHFGDGRRNIYAEDIYVGYRYFETFAREKVLYPFGFGLSYTDFSWELLEAETKGTQVRLRFSVKNTGETAGKEVLQVYISAPQGKLGKPARVLAGYEKTGLLQPGEAQELQLVTELRDFASYDDAGQTGNRSCYVLEAGEYGIFAGTDVRSARRVHTVVLPELMVTCRLREAMAPVTPFSRLRPDAQGTGIAWEDAPVRTVDLAERIRQERPADCRETKDQGYRLADVYDGKVSLMTFLAQLTDEDLACMTRGEGMCSPKVTPGTAAAFGGLTERLLAFGIPAACCSDGPSGIRMDCGAMAFSLPNGTLLACTFHRELVEELYEMEGMELRKNRIDTLLGPGMNIHRNPLNGRNFEYFSEDPYLTGTMAAAQLKGMARYGVTGTIKHFACNSQEYRRHDADAVVSERALREIYLKGFEIAVKEGRAYSVMSTYGPVNGIWTAGNYDLLTTILRGEWGYRGMVMTDWWAKMNEEGQDGTQSNTVPMVRAQNDVYMVVADAASNSAGDNTMEGLKKGQITRAQLLRNAANICSFILRSPAMERLLGRSEEVCIEKNSPQDKAGNGQLLGQAAVGDSAVLDLAGLGTQKGSRVVYQLNFAEKGRYRLTLKMRSSAAVAAQMPVTVFLNNQLIQTVTITGTDGEWISRQVELDVALSLESYLALFFGESGIEIGEIRISKE